MMFRIIEALDITKVEEDKNEPNMVNRDWWLLAIFTKL